MCDDLCVVIVTDQECQLHGPLIHAAFFVSVLVDERRSEEPFCGTLW